MKITSAQQQSLEKLHSDLHGNALPALENKANSFAQFLNSLPNFILVEWQGSQPHCGRVIVDGVLQQGHDYEKTVRPAVDKIVLFPQASTIPGFLKLLDNKPLKDVLGNWKKENTRKDLKATAEYFSKINNLNTYVQLKNWLESETNRDLFKNLGEVGPFFKTGDKTVDYFRKLVGHWDAVAVDRGAENALGSMQSR